MIERINLIEKAPFQFTHGKLVMMMGGAFALCFLLFGYQMGKTMYFSFKMKKVQAEIAWLKSENERLARTAPAKLEEGPHAELRMTLVQTPPWEKLLRDITDRLPGNVWLVSFRGNVEQATALAPNSSATSGGSSSSEAKPAPASTQRGLVLNGSAKDAMDAAGFVSRLQESPYVKNVMLTSSVKDGPDFTFVVECDIAPLGI